MFKKVYYCRKNWSGFVKGMEFFLIVKCLKLLKDKGLDVKILIMDDDMIIFVRVKNVVLD